MSPYIVLLIAGSVLAIGALVWSAACIIYAFKYQTINERLERYSKF